MTSVESLGDSVGNIQNEGDGVYTVGLDRRHLPVARVATAIVQFCKTYPTRKISAMLETTGEGGAPMLILVTEPKDFETYYTGPR